ncbi:protein kinase activating protein dpb11 [Coemansia sp. IMI 203386]|nr:protein kinase activating protein dpb11 [Coemansia sp. IMI 203386]
MVDNRQLLLKGCCISCSGIDTAEKNEIHRRVEKLGGTVSASLTTVVTHLVVKSSRLSNKYQVAAKVGIPAVSVGFLDECEEMAQKQSNGPRRRFQINDNDDNDIAEVVREITRRHRIPPFTGCRICTTGFSVEVRDEIKRFVVNVASTSMGGSRVLGIEDDSPEGFLSGGGTYHGELTPECTHLIANSASGQKYRFARQWEQQVVSLQWFVESVRMGVRQREVDFPVGPVTRGGGVAKEHDDIVDVPESSFNVQRASARQMSRQVSALSTGTAEIPQTRASEANRDLGSMGSLRAISRNNTAESGLVASQILQLDLPLGLDYSSTRVEEEEQEEQRGFVARRISRAASSASRGSRPLHVPVESLSDDQSMLLDGCHVALSSASIDAGRRRELRLKIARSGGHVIEEGAMERYVNSMAIRIPQAADSLFSSCTHYIVDDSEKLCVEDRRFLVQWNNGVRETTGVGLPAIVVKSSWLNACWDTGNVVGVEEYRVLWPDDEEEARATSVELLRPGESIDMGSDSRSTTGVAAAAAETSIVLLPPHPRHLVARRKPSGVSSRDSVSAGPLIDITSSSSPEPAAEPMLFGGCVFVSIDLTDSAEKTLKNVVADNGGEYVDLFAQLVPEGGYRQLREQRGSELTSLLGRALINVAQMASSGLAYVVVSLTGISEVPLCEAVATHYPHVHVVTECWVEQCLHDRQLHPSYKETASAGGGTSAVALFRPLWNSRVANADALLLSISGYEGIERDHIGRLAAALGVGFSERFSRKTSHLICRQPFAGPKYERAIKWQTPVVDASWLYDLALSSRPTDSSDIGSSLLNDLLLLQPVMKTPATANKSIRQRAGNIRDTPGRTPLDVSLDKCMQQALGNNNNIGVRGYDIDSTQMSPTRQTNMSNDLVINDIPVSDNRVLNGVVIALTTRLYHMRHDLARVALDLGCRFLPRFDAAQATHLVHQSHRKRETAKDYRVAVDAGIQVVSPWWLFACRDAEMRVPEVEFPYTFHPERRLRLVAAAASPAKTVRDVQGPSVTEPPSGVLTIDATKDVRPQNNTLAAAAAAVKQGVKRAAAPHGVNDHDDHDTAMAISSLFAERASRTRRKYRAPNEALEPETAATSRSSSSQNLHSTGSSSEPPKLQLDTGNPTLSAQGKWWLSAEQLSSAGYGSANNMRLYSQEFQLSGNNRSVVESMPETGWVGDSLNITGRQVDDSSSSGKGKQSSLSPCLGVQKTKIVYEEDAGARSEKERLLAKLSGSS